MLEIISLIILSLVLLFVIIIMGYVITLYNDYQNSKDDIAEIKETVLGIAILTLKKEGVEITPQTLVKEKKKFSLFNNKNN